MKEEEIKLELKSLRHLRRKIKILNEELEELNELGKIPKKIIYERTVGGNTSSAEQDKYLISLEELQENIEQVIKHETAREERILYALNKIDTESSNLLMDRYIRGKSITRLCNDYNCSRRTIYRMLDKAVKKANKLLRQEKLTHNGTEY